MKETEGIPEGPAGPDTAGPRGEGGDASASGEVLEARPVEEAVPEPVPAGAEGGKKNEGTGPEEGRERYLRLAADFENYRKRQAKERREIVATANEALVLDILPVLDNLERAIAAGTGAKDGSPGNRGVMAGVELTLRMFQGVLGRNGVERMKVLGEKFDPHRHEAIAQSADSGAEPDTILEEAEAGYTLGGRVIRPAKVRVARPPETPAAEGAGGEEAFENRES